MSNKFVRKLLKNIGLLETLRTIKRKFIYVEYDFKPCTPHLLIAVNRALRWCKENGLTEGSDYLEFGVFRGFTLWYAQALACDMEIKDMRFFGFDSFFGLPSLKGIDKGADFQEGAYYCPRKDVENFLTQHKVDWNKTFLVEGLFEKMLVPDMRKKYKLRRCSLCIIDCDLYESTSRVLSFIEPLVFHQSIILFDDWSSFAGDPNRGEQRAFYEFLNRNPHIRAEQFVDFGGHGKGFILNFC